MRRLRTSILALLLGLVAIPDTTRAADWGRFYHYPYSYFPHVYRRPFASRDFDTPHGYPMYPAYMAFPPYFRRDLWYPYHLHNEAGTNRSSRYQGMHFILDVF
jgi:hypothetical protein